MQIYSVPPLTSAIGLGWSAKIDWLSRSAAAG